MKRFMLGVALLFGAMLAAPVHQVHANSPAHFSANVPLPADFTPRQVRQILRATSQITGIPLPRLVRKYRRGRLLIEQLPGGTVQVTILRVGSNPIVVMIEDAF